ncbi:MAG TPA: GlsB/YeaQ/YmgE family stress response membrane protein [Thermodesulfovibrionales bacterium]|nr:GlsB/YeaQ/YmgE family stress response membrane protein [Thermodesulfovibrionales bacterium]
MHIIWTILVGFIVGVIAKFIHPGKENMGFIITTLLGIGGSVLATYAGQALGLYKAGGTAGFIGAIIGAIIILVIYGFIVGAAR